MSKTGHVLGSPVPELLLALIWALSWYFSLLPEQSDLLTMVLIITMFTVGSFLIVFTIRSGFTLVVFIYATTVTFLEMYIILWREDSSYYPTIVLTFLSSGTTVRIIYTIFKGKNSLHDLQEVKSDGTKPRPSTEAKIGIFSRSSPEEYSWLINYLKESSSHAVVPFVITNSNNIKFREEVYRCSCAILYHSTRRGRINITDVTDSLYDEELEYLSSELGKQNVAVVVDDLDDGSSTARNRILQSQPKIENLAWNIFLIDKEKKQNNSAITKLMTPINEMIMAESNGHSLGSVIVPFFFLAIWIAAIFCARSHDDFYNTILVVITNLKESFMIYGAAFSGSDDVYLQSDSLLPMFVDSPSRRNTSQQKSHPVCPLLLLVSAVLLAECVVVIWEVLSVKMVPYIVIALGMDLLFILLFIKGPQIFSGYQSKLL